MYCSKRAPRRRRTVSATCPTRRLVTGDRKPVVDPCFAAPLDQTHGMRLRPIMASIQAFAQSAMSVWPAPEILPLLRMEGLTGGR
jgi:hypothetical protein